MSMQPGNVPRVLSLVEVTPEDPRLAEVHAVLVQLRPHLDLAGLRAVYAEGYPQGLRFLAAYAGDRCVGVAGWRLIATTHTLRKLYVDDLVTDVAARSEGVGAALLRELELRARTAGAAVLDLDSGVARYDAHRFYFRERMAIVGHHFAKPLA